MPSMLPVIALLLASSLWAEAGGKTIALLKPWLEPGAIPASGTDSNVGGLVNTVTPQIQAAVPERLAAQPPRPRRVLVLTAHTLGALHTPGAAGLLVLLREAAKRHPSLELVEAFHESAYDAGALKAFDAVVLNNISQLDPTGSADWYNRTLPEYVHAGGGVLAIHGSALLMRKDPNAAYNHLLGGWSTENPVHPERHGQPFPVRIAAGDHPLTAAFRGPAQAVDTQGQTLAGAQRKVFAMRYEAPAFLADELYTLNPASNGDGSCRVLLAIDHERLTGQKTGPVYAAGTPEFGYALMWVRSHGAGRVWYSQFGHNFSVFATRCIAQATLDGLLYATGDVPNQ